MIFTSFFFPLLSSHHFFFFSLSFSFIFHITLIIHCPPTGSTYRVTKPVRCNFIFVHFVFSFYFLSMFFFFSFQMFLFRTTSSCLLCAYIKLGVHFLSFSRTIYSVNNKPSLITVPNLPSTKRKKKKKNLLNSLMSRFYIPADCQSLAIVRRFNPFLELF